MSNEEMLEYLLHKFGKEDIIIFSKVMTKYYEVLCEQYVDDREPCEEEYDSKWWKEAHYLLLETTNKFHKRK